MSDLLSDFLNDRIEHIPTGGVVNGVMDYEILNDMEQDSSDSDSDTEQREYVRRELESYVPEPQKTGDLSDIDDGHEESILGTDICELLSAPKVFDQYKFDTYYKKELPIDSFREKIMRYIDIHSVVIIHGPTGCGKTTQVPQYILDQCKANKAPCNIVVTQPRRIAAINISQRVCEERGWAIGTVCGYQVGLDKNVGDDVILTYVTTEVLLQKLILQKNLNKYTHIIIDEVHERSKTLDFLLLIVRKYLFTNSTKVKIILMSATMEANDFAHYFRVIPRNIKKEVFPAPIIHVNKKCDFTTNIYYLNDLHSCNDQTFSIDEPCITVGQYELALKLIRIFDSLEENGEIQMSNERKIGSVLVFLPGFHEIEEMNKILTEKKHSKLQWEIIPLHSSLTSEHMGKAFQKPKEGVRKIILSTNIAESSVTVPDVYYVIDFCLTKIMVVNELTKFATLSLQWASHNNCIQRAGRVGRVANGRVYRLVPKDFYLTEMQPNILPELQRAPLENIILYMKLLDLNDTPKNVLSLAISPPNLKDIESCIWHLKEVGALLQTCRGKKNAADGDLTFIGRVMGSLPIDIHLAKMIILGHMFCCLEETVIMAAGCTTRNLFVNTFNERIKCFRKKLIWADGCCSDFVMLLNLYHVWLQKKRDNAFRTTNEEYAWCKKNFVNLKGLREWAILIKEINTRLKKLKIEKPLSSKIKLNPAEKSIILKVVICGAFYPNYFIRSSDYGQIDGKEAVKILSGRDPQTTVYFTNMKVNQPGHIYVRQIKKLLKVEDNPNVHIGFDKQSSKVFVEYKNVREPESITVNGRQMIATITANISPDVYEAVRKRQLKIPFRLEVLPDREAWEFANSTEEKLKEKKPEDVNCFTTINYCPLPSLDMEYMSVIVTHVEDAGHFYCQNWNDETRLLLDSIFMALNGPGVFLRPVEDKFKVDSEMYAAMFNEDGKFYRCKVITTMPGHPPYVQVMFVDYGNVQKVPANRLYVLPEREECHIRPVAMCCVLSEVQPTLAKGGVWPEDVNNHFKQKTEGVLLNAKVYSVVSDVVHLELFRQQTGPSAVSFNQWLINEGWAEKSEESYLSKMDHTKRQQVLNSENPITVSELLNMSDTQTSYNDYESPDFRRDSVEIVELRGPFSPLEMKVCGVVQASVGSTIQVEGESVNAVLLDDNPQDPHARMLVAGQVTISATSRTIKIGQTTMMPSIPGLPMLMVLIFCPQMEPKATVDGSRIASVLCGLGYKEVTERPNYPVHDIAMTLDTELTGKLIEEVNKVRYYMNNAVKTMSNINDEIVYEDELTVWQQKIHECILGILHYKQKSVDRTNVKFAEIWNKNACDDLEIMTMTVDKEDDDIWPMLWFLKLNQDKSAQVSLNKNLDELNQIGRRLAPEREISCELCKSDILYNISDVRIHLFRDEHKKNLARYLQETKQKEKE